MFDNQEQQKEKEKEKDREREDRIHYPNYDEVVTAGHRRQHKKSLSDCGEVPQQHQAVFGEVKE